MVIKMTNKFKTNLPLIGIGLICLLLIALFAASRVFGNLRIGENGRTNQNEAVISITSGVHSASDAANFLSGYGWEVREEPSSVKSVQIPDEFTTVYHEYNQLQKAQGFDLTDYRSKTAAMYTFRILNHDSHSNGVFANVLVYDGEVIAGDVVSYALDGFLTGLDGKLTGETRTR